VVFQASQRRVRVQKQAAADTAKEQVTAMSSKCSHQLQDKLDGMRAENSKLLGRLADITSKWQATVVENAALNAQNGDVQAQLGEMQHAVAMLQRERDELRRALQQQRPAQCQQQQMQLAMLQQQQQQQVAWTPVDHGHAHGAAAGQWAHW
jgi:chromosome segregation ATPase